MAITLVTGLPGHGKTLYTLFRWKDEAAKAKRPVFHNDIPGLNIPTWQVWKAADWQQLPAGALLILDEAWKDFPVRGRGEPPPHVGELARHRHLGIDIVLIAQDPSLIDVFVRRLVDRHFHVVRKFGTHFATIHEYANGVKETVAKSRGQSIRHEWRFPKHVFEWYTSSEKHTVTRRIPMRVWVLLAMPFVFAALVWVLWARFKPSFTGEAAQPKPMSVESAASGAVIGVQPRPQNQREVQTPQQYAASYTPRIEGLPHTAPVYDDATKPVDAPYPAACISMPSKKRCSCYSQQATKLEMSQALCEQIAAGGFFVSWKQQVVQAVPVQAASAVAPSYAGPVGIDGLRAPQVALAEPAVPPDLGAPPRQRR